VPSTAVLIQIGFLDQDEPKQLVAGQFVVRALQNTPHTTAVGLADEALRRVFMRRAR
jgi:hypothetical protein